MFKLTDEVFKKKIRRRSWIQIANIPKARVGWLLDDCVSAAPKVLADVKRWVNAVGDNKIILASGEPHCGRGMLLYGQPGRGKTTLAAAAIQEMLLTFSLDTFVPNEGKVLVRPCYFTTFNDVLSLMGKLMDNEPYESDKTLYEGILGDCKDDAYNIRVLVLDDVGKEHTTLSGWQKNTLHHLLRTRFNNGLPTIVTTNISRDDWAASYGDATGSFVKEAFVYITVDGTQDLR